MNWNIVLVCVIVVLMVVAAWLASQVRQLSAEHRWESSCPIRDTEVTVYEINPPPAPSSATLGETQWERTLREVGDPADVLTTGDEFAMPEAK